MRHLVLVLFLAIAFSEAHNFLHPFKTIHRPIPPGTGEPLILTPLIEKGQLDEAKNKSKVNHAHFKNTAFYSGYFQVDKEFDNNLFFYFFPSENDYKNDPVILWLQGGPGGPSAYGLFVENGPFSVNKNFTLDPREYRWTKNHSVLYIDNPVGTGFSFTTKLGYAQNQTKVGQDLYGALIQFFTLFSEIKSNDFYIVGESYAGKYVPAIGYTILQNNPKASLKINLKGLATGNGLSDPINQADYGAYLYQLGMVDATTRNLLDTYKSLVERYVNDHNWRNATNYFADVMNTLIEQATGVESEYNYVQFEPNEEEYYWQIYLQEHVRDALHVGTTQFNNGPVYDLLYNDIAKSVAPWIVELLSHYKFLAYNGQLDIIVAYPMMVNYLQNLNFSAAEEYKTAERQIWLDRDGVVGYYKEAGNLTELLIRNAGHMVPVNQPKRAYNMIYKFVRGLSFNDDN